MRKAVLLKVSQAIARAASICLAFGSLPAGAEESKPNAAGATAPNIVLIVADDLGWGELGIQGGTDIPTPYIDSLAKNGARFTNGYVSCPVCSPTRAGLMTGRYQQRFGHEFNPGPAEKADVKFGLPLTEKTLADRLKAAGYATGMTGKWHLGYRPEFHPQKRGFDEFFGFLGGAHKYLAKEREGQAGGILRGATPVDEQDYLTDALAREATAFIGRHVADRFFLYLPFNAVHAPLQTTAKYRDRFAGIMDPKRQTFAAMLSAMDDAIGAVLTKLRDSGLEEKTLVFFISDNGGPTQSTTSRNGPLRGSKGQVYEGGIRVPFMMQWKGRIPAGRVVENPVIAIDIAPTALAAAGAGGEGVGFDGVNLLPLAEGKEGAKGSDSIYWRFGEQAALRKGDWKLVRSKGTDWELYNLKEDIGEDRNLADTKPAEFAELKGVWEKWNSGLERPRWANGRAANRAANPAAADRPNRPGKRARGPAAKAAKAAKENP